MPLETICNWFSRRFWEKILIYFHFFFRKKMAIDFLRSFQRISDCFSFARKAGCKMKWPKWWKILFFTRLGKNRFKIHEKSNLIRSASDFLSDFWALFPEKLTNIEQKLPKIFPNVKTSITNIPRSSTRWLHLIPQQNKHFYHLGTLFSITQSSIINRNTINFNLNKKKSA